MARAGHLPLPSVAARGSGFGAAVFVAAAAALAYVIAAHIGFRLAFVAEQVTTVWAPSGIAIATLLLWGPRLWPAIWIGAFAANAVTTAPLWTAVFIATGNTLEAVAAASILGRVPGFSPTLRRVADVLAFLIAAVVLCPAISASIGVTTLASAGVQPWTRFTPLWWNWWFGDALGAVIVAPAILMTVRRDWPRGDLLRAAAFVAAAIAITGLVFGSASFNTHPIEYIVFPLAIAAAVSGGPAITSLVVLCASSIAIWYTSRGAGPFSGQTVHDSLVLLQVFMGVLAATALLLAAAIAERRASEDREHEAAEVLRHREEMLRLAQRAGGVATFEWDFTRQTAICSAEFFRIFGLPAVEGVMIASDWANYVHPDDREPMATHLSRALAGLEPAAADYRIVTAQGQTRWLSYAGQIEKTEDGERLLGTVVDITHRKDLETELRQANDVKDEFLATLSHELRTPLNAVLGWAHMLRENTIEPSMRDKALESLERNARAQAQLVEDLLDVSRIRSGKLPVRSDPVDLADVVRNAVETVQAGVAAKGLTLQMDVPDAPPLFVVGDGDRLQQVIWNLVANAVKFTPPGGRVDVGLRGLDGHAEIVVRDTGQGIDPAFRPRLFQRFSQMDGSKSRAHGGLGLGLSIVKHLVEAHGGTVDAESDGIGRGASFRVRLPLRSGE